MKDMFKATNSMIYVYAGFGLLMLLAYSLTTYINSNLENVSIHMMPRTQSTQKTIDVKKLYPVWIAATKKTAESTDATSADALFREKKVEEAPKPTGPDYPNLLASRLRADAAGTNGAFINGKYYHIGEQIKEFEYDWQGKHIIPLLSEVTPKHAVIKHGVKTDIIKF